MILTEPLIDPQRLEAETGWALKPEGACKDDRCVLMPPGAGEGPVAADVLAERLGMALVADPDRCLWALGPEAGGRALASARMPELELPDHNGRPFSLRSLRGTKVIMIAWASW